MELPVGIHAPEVEAPEEPFYEVDKILKWRKIKRGRRTIREFLVTWTGYPLEEAQSILEANWRDPRQLNDYIKQDRPTEEKGRPSTSSVTPSF